MNILNSFSPDFGLKIYGGYIADVPDLPNCSAFGDTPAQALAEVQLAKEA